VSFFFFSISMYSGPWLFVLEKSLLTLIFGLFCFCCRGNSYIGSDGTLRARLEARLTRGADDHECVVC
jgi:hypothetical protein